MHQRFADAINQDPDNRDLQLIYADWLDGQGDPRAEAWRVLIEAGRFPEKCIGYHPGLVDWRWYQSPLAGRAHQLDLEWIITNKVVYYGTHRTIFSAMDAAAVAWVRWHRDPEFLRESAPA
jgi:uncharacterized protein (TIGR02996 family)